MSRDASPEELAAMTETEQAAYAHGRPFSYGERGLTPIAGTPGAGVYIVQRAHQALRETLTAMKEV